MRSVYIVGSLHNSAVTVAARRLREEGHTVFDDWYSPGPDADAYWREYEEERGRTYIDALAGAHAKNVFDFDMRHLTEADTVVMVLPAGKSAHLEMGWAACAGKDCYIVLGDENPWDVMYKMVEVVPSVDHLLSALSVNP